MLEADELYNSSRYTIYAVDSGRVYYTCRRGLVGLGYTPTARYIKAGAHQGNWQPQRNYNFRELLSAWVEHMLLNGAAQIEERATQFHLHCSIQ
jgi:hypothetical protein